MKLVHCGTTLCDIVEVAGDFPWMCGNLEYNSLPPSLRELFEFLTDESKSAENPPFAESLLDPSHWHVLENSEMRGIEVPAVHADGVIMWR